MQVKTDHGKPSLSSPKPTIPDYIIDDATPTIAQKIAVKHKKLLVRAFQQVLETRNKKADRLQANPLQPDMSLVNILKQQLVTVGGCTYRLHAICNNLAPSTWASTFKACLFSSPSMQAKVADQEERARKCSELVGAEKATNLVFPDGHGRFTACLINALVKRLSATTVDSKLGFELVDLNDAVVAWHKAFFPRNFVHAVRNLYVNLPSRDTVLYLNFCGIGGLQGQRDLVNFLHRMAKALDAGQDVARYLMLSFSNVRGARIQHGDKPTAKTMIEAKELPDWIDEFTWEHDLKAHEKKFFKAVLLKTNKSDTFPTYVVTVLRPSELE